MKVIKIFKNVLLLLGILSTVLSSISYFIYDYYIGALVYITYTCLIISGGLSIYLDFKLKKEFQNKYRYFN